MDNIVTSDERGRITLGKLIDKKTPYQVSRDVAGSITLVPCVTIPKWEASVLKGLKQAEKGKTGSLPKDLQDDMDEVLREMQENGEL